MTTPLASDEQLHELTARLDLESKVRLLTGATAFMLYGDERIGLAPMAFSDGPAGVRGLKFAGDAAALLPNATLIASSWSEHTAYQVGRIVAEEAQRQHIHVVLGPTINLHRTPLGGRLFEAYSEDPLLTGRLAAGYVRGVQEAGIGACLKHLVANEAETLRTSVDNRVDARTLREVYLLPFEIAVADADPWTLMAAYNDVNGVAATEHDEINNGVVKGEWGYQGLIMSDWSATRTSAAAANGGLDLVMPGPVGPWGPALVAAVRRGAVAESVVDEHVCRLLRLAARVGALGRQRNWPEHALAPAAPARADQLRRVAAAGMTVLTNDGVLPLAPGIRVALIGRHAIETVAMGGGSAQVMPPYSVGIAEGLDALLGVRLTTVDGVEVRSRAVPARTPHVVDPVSGVPGVRVVCQDAFGSVLDERVLAAAEVLIGPDEELAGPIATVILRARVSIDGPAEVGTIGLGEWTLRAGEAEYAATLRPAGSDPGEAVFNPPVWLAPDELELPGAVVEATAYLRSPGDAEGPAGVRTVRLGLVARPTPRDPDVVLAEAAAAAADADVAVVVVGLTDEQETEGVDKGTLALPGRQDDLVRAVAAVAPGTVVVVNAATPVLMPWADAVAAILWAGLPGQEGGHAVAAALVGDLEPSGRLVTTFPSADGASPAWGVTPVHGRLTYTEGRFVGYRGYAAGSAPAPAFWFGHGLGYGSWEYGPASVQHNGTAVSVTVQVRNTGYRRSREVIQVYLEPSSVDEPTRLVGWAGVEIDAGGTAEVQVACDDRMWRAWDDSTGRWGRLPPGGSLVVARGLGDVRARIALASGAG